MEAIAPALRNRPSVCHQTSDEHTHYNINTSTTLPNDTDIEILKRLKRQVGGQTAGQIIEALSFRLRNGEPCSKFGLKFVEIETLPIRQICHKGESDSPAIDWDATV